MFTVTGFPRPVSPLQDVSTIIGSREQLALPLQLYDYQLEHEVQPAGRVYCGLSVSCKLPPPCSLGTSQLLEWKIAHDI